MRSGPRGERFQRTQPLAQRGAWSEADSLQDRAPAVRQVVARPAHELADRAYAGIAFASELVQLREQTKHRHSALCPHIHFPVGDRRNGKLDRLPGIITRQVLIAVVEFG